ncbi:MAG: FAD-binding domain [Hyphomonas sp.]|nr:FAD-binding domain [Hyphomonas sp.]
MKIAISGAGVAGPALAHWLLRTGHEPTLIEEAPEFRAGGYVIDFWGIGYDVIEKMGILPEVLARGYQVQEVRLVKGSGAKAAGFSADVFRRMTHDRFTSLPRGDLAEIIYDSVKDKAETLFGNSVTKVQDMGDAVSVTLLSGETRNFDLLVGADGLHSNVRRLVWGEQEAFERPVGFHVAAFVCSDYRHRDEDAYVSFAVPDLSISRFALRDNRTLALFIFGNDRMTGPMPHDPAAKKALLHQIFAGAGWETHDLLDAMDETNEIYLDRVSQSVVPSWSKGRTVLIGDAAACPSLLAGEGTGLAIAEAYVLAGELKQAGSDLPAALRAYETRLRPFLEGKQKAALAMASTFAPKTKFGIWLRNMATHLMVIPPIADMFVGDSVKDDVDLPDYGM